MKKILYFLPAFLFLAACGPKKTYSYDPSDVADAADAAEVLGTDSTTFAYRTYCPSDSAVNHMHEFAIQNVYPTNLLNQDGWFCEVCQFCGQEFMFNNDFVYSKQEGTVCAFRSPETGQFTDFCICYQDEDGNFLYRTVSRQNLRYVPQAEDTDSI